MPDTFAWIILLLVPALAVGYVMGRRSASGRGPAAPSPVPAPVVPVPVAARPPVAPSPLAPSASPQVASAPRPARPTPAATASNPLASVTSWGYQLQDLDVKRAAASSFDLLVIDTTKDGDDESRLQPAEIDRLKSKPDGARRIVVAYCSIGEAESYRPYWQKGWKRGNPAWLLGENPEWEENYAVCFWDPGWQNLLWGSPEALIDRLIAQGFDGIYLDKCDVTEDLREHFKAAARTRPDLDGDMVAFVERLSAYVKGKKPGFLVIMQNAEPLLERPRLRAAIDAVAKEELLFGLDAAERPNQADDVAEAKAQLDLLRREGKPVFVVEYLSAAPKQREATQRLREMGYVPYVAPKDRELDRLLDPAPLTS